MKITTKNNWPYIFLVLVLLTGCKPGTELVETEKKKERQKLSNKELLKSERMFMEASKAKMLGDMEEALQLYTEVTKINPFNDAAFFEVAKIYLDKGQNELAKTYAEQAVKLDPVNKWYRKRYAEALALNNEFGTAANIYRELINDFPNEYEYYLDLAFMLIQNDQTEKAIEIYDSLEQKIGVTESIILQKQRLYIQLNQIEKAVEEVEKLIEANPGEARYYGLLAEFYQANDMYDKALETFQRLLKADPGNARGYLSLAQLYRKMGEHDKAYEYMKRSFSSPAINIDQKVGLLFPYINRMNEEGARKEGLELSQIIVETHPEEAKAHSIYGDLLYHADSLQKARQEYLKTLALDNSRFTVWQQILFVDSELEEYDSLLKHSEEALELFPNQTLAYFFKSVAEIQQDKNEEAVATIEHALNIGTDNKTLMGQLYSNLGDAYHNLEEHEKSDSAYEKSLKYDPDNVYVLNNYSYYLSLRGKNLEHAKSMARKANEIMPDNASFQDTYGWILYKLGQYEDAVIWIGKALNNGGDERPVVLEHYGDVLYRLNKKEEAVKYWKEAHEHGADSKMIEKKIKNEQLYE